MGTRGYNIDTLPAPSCVEIDSANGEAMDTQEQLIRGSLSAYCPSQEHAVPFTATFNRRAVEAAPYEVFRPSPAAVHSGIDPDHTWNMPTPMLVRSGTESRRIEERCPE